MRLCELNSIGFFVRIVLAQLYIEPRFGFNHMVLMHCLSEVSCLFFFLNFSLSITRLLINWFLIKKDVYENCGPVLTDDM